MCSNCCCFNLIAPFDTDDRCQKATFAVLHAMIDIAAQKPSAVAPANQPPSSWRSTHLPIWDKSDRGTAATATSMRSQGSVQRQLDVYMYTSDAPIARSACPLVVENKSHLLPRHRWGGTAAAICSSDVSHQRVLVLTCWWRRHKRNQLSPSWADRVLFLMENL